jgi:hypothetical protein
VTGDETAFDGRELPDGLIADVLRRLPPHSLAVSRCVCRGWRDLVDAGRLLRVDLLPRSVGGIFMPGVPWLAPRRDDDPPSPATWISSQLASLRSWTTATASCFARTPQASMTTSLTLRGCDPAVGTAAPATKTKANSVGEGRGRGRGRRPSPNPNQVPRVRSHRVPAL